MGLRKAAHPTNRCASTKSWPSRRAR